MPVPMARGGLIPIRAPMGGRVPYGPPPPSTPMGMRERPAGPGLGRASMVPRPRQSAPVRAAQGGILDEILRQQGDEAQASNPQATRPMLDWQDTESGAAGATSPQGQAPPAPGGPDFMGGMGDILMELRGQPSAQGPYRSSIRRGVELAGKAMGMGAARGGRVSNRRQALFAGLSQQGNREGLSQRR
jgi:hypothetical protein